MTAVTENTENVATPNGTEPTPEVESTEPAVKYPTYLQLAKAVWKLAYDLSPYGERDTFCVDGVNGYLAHFDLPKLVEVEDNVELMDSYVDAWFRFKYWTATGEFDPVDDESLRSSLARRVRTYLGREEPKPRATMNEWLTELGLETFAPPAPPRHVGSYHVTYDASTEVNSERIAEALRQQFPTLNVQVAYERRVR